MSSLVIVEKSTGRAIFETFNLQIVKTLNTAKYEAIPIVKYLGDLNAAIKEKTMSDHSAEISAIAKAEGR